jgi:tRNA dimethylallyltransferase
MNKLIIISGPTATGKTNTSIELAKSISAQIINFDSLLFYKELNIGTAKPGPKEMQGITHHQVGIRSICSPLNAFDYSTETIKLINQLHLKNVVPILVGGSGFYLQAVLKGMYPSMPIAQEILLKSERIYQESGIQPFLDILEKNDPLSFERYHCNDHYRIRRAVEFFWGNKVIFSAQRKSKELENIKQKNWPSNQWDIFHIYLDLPKDEHWEIIQARTKKMISMGLVDETEELLKKFNSELKPLKSIGYKEAISWLKGNEFKSKEDFIERIDISTRQLAKSQRTWFQKVEKKQYHPLADQHKIKNDILGFLAS